jgi:hypothetical protein
LVGDYDVDLICFYNIMIQHSSHAEYYELLGIDTINLLIFNVSFREKPEGPRSSFINSSWFSSVFKKSELNFGFCKVCLAAY